MLILVTNDDGVQSAGLLALKRSLEQDHQVAVLAPDRNWSAAGHSRRLHDPLTLRTFRLEDGSSVTVSDGTPSDCVALALMGLVGERPDLVVSGINRGPNVGSDVTYSGTVAAAMEAVLFGVPGIAISLDGYSGWDFSPAAEFARHLVNEVAHRKLPPEVLLNVNVPNRPAGEIQGIAITRLGRRIYCDEWTLLEEQDGVRRYRLDGAPPTGELLPGTDIAALDAGYVSLTPLHLDLTAHHFLEEMRAWDLRSPAVVSPSPTSAPSGPAPIDR
jgi:5'-nucleotidase